MKGYVRGEWIPTAKSEPPTSGAYLVTYYHGGEWKCGIDYFRADKADGKWKNHIMVKAWQPLPEPYEKS